MNQRFLRYSLFVLIAFSAIACHQAKYVPEGYYLHKKNEISFETVDKDGEIVVKSKHDQIYSGDMYDLIRPETNKRVKLFFYNRIDSTRHKNQLKHKEAKYKKKNERRAAKVKRINDKRIAKAKSKGKDYYTQKIKEPKETRNGWRDWVVVHMGEAPVILDTSLVIKSSQQLDIYLSKRGFFDAKVSDTIVYKEKKKKAFVMYRVVPGQPYIIDSISLHKTVESSMVNMYDRYLKKELSVLHVGDLVDEDVLDTERDKFSKYCRDEAAFFEFNKSYITFEVDTNNRDHQAHVVIHIGPKALPDPQNRDSTVFVAHRVHYVRNVTFLMHNPDTMSFKNGFTNFKRRCFLEGLPIMSEGRYTLLDTLINIDTIFRRGKEDIVKHKGIYVYNEKPFLNPDLLDKQNFLEMDFYAKEYYLERTYRTMLQLDVFSSITPIVKIDPNDPLGTNVHVTYHLVPAKRQTFTIEPRFTNSNSILGLMGQVSYTNKNLFGGAQKLKVSFIGGFESQPLIVDIEGVENRAWQLNTFEWGPSIQLSFPKLVPLPAKTQQLFSKRAYPSTTFDLTVNFQKRVEFRRRLAHFSYDWSFKQDKTQEWKLKWFNFNFVKLDKEQVFEDKLIQINDPFLLNSYADHFSIFNQLDYHYTNQHSNEFKNIFVHDFKTSVLQSGGILNASGIGAASLSDQGLKQIFGVPFTQFVKWDNQYIFNWRFSKKHKLATRLLAGMGWAYGNSPSLPYEQSFFAGGSNDIRAFEARTMAPGSIRIYEDTSATLTQIGDMRLEVNLEYRFYITDLFEGAFFVDMGNIWKVQDDPTTTKDDLGVFYFDSFYKQVAIGTGLGIRADFDFLIVRLDVSFPLHNPYLPAGERWFGTPHPTYIANWDEGPSGNNNGVIDHIKLDKKGNIISGDTNGNGKADPGDETYYPYHHPFGLRFNIGIGYPF